MELIDAMTEIEGYAAAMVRAELANAESETHVRIRGANGRIEYLDAARERQRLATEAARLKREENRVKVHGPTSDPMLESDLGSNSRASLDSSSTSSSSSNSTKEEKKKRSADASAGDPGSFDLEDAYRLYPRKEGKTPGMKTLARQIKTLADYNAFVAAIERYRECDNVKRGFVQKFSTFANQWRDWLDPETGQPPPGEDPFAFMKPAGAA